MWISEEVRALFFYYLYFLTRKPQVTRGVEPVLSQEQVSIFCPRKHFFVCASRSGILSKNVLLVLAPALPDFFPLRSARSLLLQWKYSSQVALILHLFTLSCAAAACRPHPHPFPGPQSHSRLHVPGTSSLNGIKLMPELNNDCRGDELLESLTPL